MTPKQILDLRKEYLMPCLGHFYKNPPVFVRGEMQYLYDQEGKKYLDFFAGVSVMNCGHSNPFILEAVIKQMHTLQHLTNIYLTQPIVELAAKLAQVLPGDLKASFFCNSGSEANEGALLLARIYTGKRKFIALQTGLHGRTNLTMAVTGIPMWQADPFLPRQDVYFVSSNFEQGLAEIKQILKNDPDIAAFIAEPIAGNGGIIIPPDWFFPEVIKLLDNYGGLFICDEIQTGFARTGKMFAIEHFNAVPDILTMSKALGNGIPIAAFCTTRKIADKFTAPSASTLGGNPVSSAAAMAVLEYIQLNDLCAHAQELGKLLLDGLLELKAAYPHCVAAVRGKGLMQGMELCDSGGNPLAQQTDELLEYLKDNGVIVGKNGLSRNVLAFQPPLVINREDISFLLEKLGEGLALIKL